MKVIGAGLPRTATLTQKISLEMLGFGPCYHMVNVLQDLSLAPQWAAAFDGNPDWDKVFAGHQASVDWPGSFFWRDLAEHYPDAKVLLSVRTGDSWATSMKNTIWGVFYDDVLMRHLSDARANIDTGWRDYIELMKAMWQKSGLIGEMTGLFDPAVLGAAMERHNQEVRDTIPAERLLEWKPADGWEPLCEFLEVPVPQAPIPHVNDSAMFAGRIVDGSLAVLNDGTPSSSRRPRRNEFPRRHPAEQDRGQAASDKERAGHPPGTAAYRLLRIAVLVILRPVHRQRRPAQSSGAPLRLIGNSSSMCSSPTLWTMPLRFSPPGICCKWTQTSARPLSCSPSPRWPAARQRARQCSSSPGPCKGSAAH